MMPTARVRMLHSLVATSLLGLACHRTPSEPTLETDAVPQLNSARAARASERATQPAMPGKAAETSPAALMPGALGVASEELPVSEPKGAPLVIKSSGRAGEWLEGDVFMFRLLSTKQCGEPVKAPGAAANDSTGAVASTTSPEPTTPALAPSRTVVAAKVEIRAKAKMAVSPRDIILSKGGISFYGSVDPERRLNGCTPLLKISRLRQNEVATGYVLFDLPNAELKAMQLSYQPTRWGGAGQVRVSLGE